ncbi:MAG: energy transducer TonB [Saprospiraceae bacterium]|nr:energy transducer TonB [Saprospiraceae bacterium]
MAFSQNDTIPPFPPFEEVKPEYPGGEMALYQFISANLDYPDNASRKGIQGTVYTQFFIDEEGNVIEPTIVRALTLNLMPRRCGL